MLSQELLDQGSLRGIGAVPQKDHMATPVLEQLPEETHNLQGADVLVRMEPCVEGDALAFGGQRDRGDGRDFIPVLGTSKKRRPPSWGPGSAHARDQQEPTLIEESQMGPKPFRVFLYAASDTASSAR